MSDKESPIHLSIVAASRNDNHGKNLLRRMQHFVDGILHQTEKYQIPSELILVEWNPLPNHPGLADVLRFQPTQFCKVRIIQVPNELHNTLENADKLPFFQMVAKNVGIRRAKGRFVLATNIDILFSESLMKFLKSKLQSKYLYRVDRLDVPEDLPATKTHDDLLMFCKNNFFRINGKYGTYFRNQNLATVLLQRIGAQILKKGGKQFSSLIYLRHLFKNSVQYCIACIQELRTKKISPLKIPRYIYMQTTSLFVRWYNKIKTFFVILRTKIQAETIQKQIDKLRSYYLKAILIIKKFVLLVLQIVFPNFAQHSKKLHTNACGDFTLLSLEHWFQLRGYPEWGMYSWHIDSVLLHQAQQHGIVEFSLPRERSIYHIDHEIGSGYSHETPNALFSRLRERKIPYISNQELNQMIYSLQNSAEKVCYNPNNWGFKDANLCEIIPNKEHYGTEK